MHRLAALVCVFVLGLPIAAVSQQPAGQLPGAQRIDGQLNFGIQKPGIPDVRGIELRLAEITGLLTKWENLPDRLESATWHAVLWGSIFFWAALCGMFAFIAVMNRRQ